MFGDGSVCACVRHAHAHLSQPRPVVALPSPLYSRCHVHCCLTCAESLVAASYKYDVHCKVTTWLRHGSAPGRLSCSSLSRPTLRAIPRVSLGPRPLRLGGHSVRRRDPPAACIPKSVLVQSADTRDTGTAAGRGGAEVTLCCQPVSQPCVWEESSGRPSSPRYWIGSPRDVFTAKSVSKRTFLLSSQSVSQSVNSMFVRVSPEVPPTLHWTGSLLVAFYCQQISE